MTNERALPLFYIAPRATELPYHAMLFSRVVLTHTTSVDAAREQEGFMPESIGVEIGVPLNIGLYAFASKERRDKFIRLANADSEIENAVAVKLQHL